MGGTVLAHGGEVKVLTYGSKPVASVGRWAIRMTSKLHFAGRQIAAPQLACVSHSPSTRDHVPTSASSCSARRSTVPGEITSTS